MRKSSIGEYTEWGPDTPSAIDDEARIAQWRAAYAVSCPWQQEQEEQEDEGGES